MIYKYSGCSGLTSITIPSSVTSLGPACCYGCSGLTSITIPSSLTSLGTSCFEYCRGLTSITIPSPVTSLGSDCFDGCIGLETVYFKGIVPGMYNGGAIPTTCIIKVPSEYLQDYKDAFGRRYKYIYAWDYNESGDDDKPVTQCATPSVSYEAGELKFACETAGAKYHYTISDNDMATDALSEDGKVSLSAAYNISVYATADGYTASEKAEATLFIGSTPIRKPPISTWLKLVASWLRLMMASSAFLVLIMARWLCSMLLMANLSVHLLPLAVLHHAPYLKRWLLLKSA